MDRESTEKRAWVTQEQAPAIVRVCNIATHLLERGIQVLPIPLGIAAVELGAPQARPPVVVVLGPTVKVLPIDSGPTANSHAEDDGGGAVVDALDGGRGDDEAGGALAVLLGVVVADGALDLAVLDDEDGACGAFTVSFKMAVSRRKSQLSTRDPAGMTYAWGRRPRRGPRRSNRRFRRR